MARLPDEVVSAIGRLTIAAGDLELILAWIGADQAGGNAFEVLARPGEPVRAARGSVEFATPEYRRAYLPVVEIAAKLLARRHAVVSAMWISEAPDESVQRWQLLDDRTYIRQLVDPRALDELSRQLLEARNRLVAIVTAQLNNDPVPAS
ncbi:hypothetical protein ACN27G_32845 [Plantactinospora sp. WMMB334]|uniref:hypothetical protein n=1 Tax=Plantactinospora sp. WMMB334 TaxID=3404119 RepID=UPI003B92683C